MEIDVKLLKELREKTGIGIMECKQALTETKCDITRAIEWLKRRGITLAEKKMDKKTTAGRVGSYIHLNGKVGVLLELSCETDFVANTEEFQQLLKDLCLQVAAMSPKTISRNELPKEVIEKEKEYYRQEVKDKPAGVVDKIVEGKLEKFFYSQQCLLDQAFIKDETVKIGDLIKGKIAKFAENIAVQRFVRFEMGKN